jgi:hypothetical protein
MAKNPVEEFLTEKRAFGAGLKSMGAKAAPVLGRMGEQAGTAALAGVGAAGFAGLIGAAGKLYDAATKTRDFQNMLEANQDLHEHLHADPGGFNRMFTSLRKFSPEFTKDPMVAGSLMRQGMNSNPEDRGNLVLRAQRERVFPKQGPATEAAMGGFMKGMGGGGEGKKPQLLRQTKTVSRMDQGGAVTPDRIEEAQNYYG